MYIYRFLKMLELQLQKARNEGIKTSEVIIDPPYKNKDDHLMHHLKALIRIHLTASMCLLSAI